MQNSREKYENLLKIHVRNIYRKIVGNWAKKLTEKYNGVKTYVKNNEKVGRNKLTELHKSLKNWLKIAKQLKKYENLLKIF